MKNWKIINGSENVLVSNFGDVKSSTGFIYTTFTCKRTGYQKVNLKINGEIKQCAVHKLVAEAFVANPFNKPEVNHKNGDKTNNCEWNLEWVTPYENQMHRRYVLGKRTDGEFNPMFGKSDENNPKFKDWIVAVREDGTIVGKYPTQVSAAINLLNKYERAHTLSKCLRHTRNNKAFGYYWMYEKEYELLTRADLKPCELLEHPELWIEHYLGQSAAKPHKEEGSTTIENITER